MLKKRLILRLSSLGDVILTTAVLEVPHQGWLQDWVVSEPYQELLLGHPKINQVLPFRRSLGLPGWIQLCRKVHESHYDEILDLHKTLRTRMMRVLLKYWSIREGKPFPNWKTISKGKLQLYFYFALKKFYPQSLKPKLWVERFSRFAGGTGQERPSLKHLLEGESLPDSIENLLKEKRKYLCVMPSSRWDGKKWPVSYYLTLLKRLPDVPVILGTEKDPESLELVAELKRQSHVHVSGIGLWNLKKTAFILSRSAGYLGSDTGLAHLAEAVGIPVRMIMGPTTPEMGFGPWRKESRTLQSDLWCRPCGKDGRYCFRPVEKYACLKRLSPETVLETFKAD